MYFDTNADGIITSEERLETQIYQKPVDKPEKQPFIGRTTCLVKPLQVEMTYARADGSAFSKPLTFAVEAYAVLPYISLDVHDMDKMKDNLKSFNNPICYARIVLETCFIGEVSAEGGRVLKVAVVDGNQNGIFNEVKVDYLVLDLNHDGIFDWAKERKPLGKELSGLHTNGKKGQLSIAVAPWPRNLVLMAEGATVDPANLD